MNQQPVFETDSGVTYATVSEGTESAIGKNHPNTFSSLFFETAHGETYATVSERNTAKRSRQQSACTFNGASNSTQASERGALIAPGYSKSASDRRIRYQRYYAKAIGTINTDLLQRVF